MAPESAESPFLLNKTPSSSGQYKRRDAAATTSTGRSFATASLETTPTGRSGGGGGGGGGGGVGGIFSPLNGINLYRRRLVAAASTPSSAVNRTPPPSLRYRILRSTACMIAIVGTIWFALNLSSGDSFTTGNSANVASDSTAASILDLDTTAAAAMSTSGFSFEVFGRVQGVFFRKYTERKANELGLVGWVRNTSRGSVEGEVATSAGRSVQSKSEAALQQMQHWLGKVGSPQSTIERADFAPLSEERVRKLLGEYGTFTVRKTKR